MAGTEVLTEPSADEVRRQWPWQLFVVHAVGWLLVGAFVTSFGALLLAGSGEARPGSLEQRLFEDASDGEATTLRVDFPFDHRDAHERDWASSGGSWSGTGEVRWREHGLWRHTDYVVASSEREARRLQRSGLRAIPAVVGDPDALPTEWTSLQPEIVVEPWERGTSGTGSAEFFDVEWTGPSWAVTVGLVVGFTSFLWLLVGPRPWRFTRWGWFWLVVGAWPVGVPAFLLLGGASGLIPPADPSHRWSGWSGFALSLVVALALGTLLA